VRAALDRRVVGHDHARRALDPADAGHDPGARRLLVVQAVRGEGAQLEEGRAGVEEEVDPLAHGQLAALAMSGDGLVVPASPTLRDGRSPGAKLLDEGRHPVKMRLLIRAVRVEPGPEDRHGSEDSPGPRAAPRWQLVARCPCAGDKVPITEHVTRTARPAPGVSE